uniref:Uncharacterized protein n=1 Tax=Arundo donax TaxID=35708 RepID=A0A0A9F5X2_ARUDO
MRPQTKLHARKLDPVPLALCLLYYSVVQYHPKSLLPAGSIKPKIRPGKLVWI